jgi:hypothetical protein
MKNGEFSQIIFFLILWSTYFLQLLAQSAAARVCVEALQMVL